MKLLQRAAALSCISLFALSAAHGQATRTFVSGTGDDANPCSRTAPCKTFTGALALKTAEGGEVDVLDPGGFGTVTISQAVTIDGGGGQVASVLSSNTTGITINAAATDVVTLRNLRLNGTDLSTSPGTIGVNIVNAKAVHIENCVIFGFNNAGVRVSGSTPVTLFIDHSLINGNLGSGVIIANGGTTPTLATIANSTIQNNSVGVLASGNSKVTVQKSIASGNTGAGFQADASAGPATLNLVSAVSSNNGGAGIQASSSGSSNAVVRMTGVSLFSNGSGLSTGANGFIYSYGDNNITGGGTVSSTLAKQ